MKTPIQSFRDLRVWQASMTLVELVYAATTRLPREETYGLSAQMRRAAISIPSNIAEGHSSESTRSYLRYLAIARASAAELETQIEIAARLDYLGLQQTGQLNELLRSIGMQLFALRDSLRLRLVPHSLAPSP